jgi:hypothetical protein
MYLTSAEDTWPTSSAAHPIYTPITEGLAALRAQSDPALAREILAFANPPHAFQQRLHQTPLILFRAIVTANYETDRFLGLAAQLGIPPLFLEMTNVAFAPAVNATTRRLAKPPVTTASGYRAVRIIDFHRYDGAQLPDIRCHDGRPLVAVHHELLGRQYGPRILDHLVDGNPFIGSEGPRGYYERLFALVSVAGIQAESFLFDGPEACFTHNIIMPAIEATKARFGVRPIIVPLLPPESESDPRWEYYPPEALMFFKQVACIR